MGDGSIMGRLVGFLHHTDADSAVDAFRRAGAVETDGDGLHTVHNEGSGRGYVGVGR